MPPIAVAAFYKFISLPSFAALRQPLRELCYARGIRGTILLAPEGINGTIAGEPGRLEETLERLREIAEFYDLDSKLSFAAEMPFRRLKIRLKKEIVKLGVASADPNTAAGSYVDAKDWNALIADPDVLVIDARNNYEVQLGRFQGAVDPHTKSFGEFPAFVRDRLSVARGRKIAMYCTGGIRCEKATSFLRQEGFEEVFHLKGGILEYLRSVPEEQSLWQGRCFVFDEREAVGYGAS